VRILIGGSLLPKNRGLWLQLHAVLIFPAPLDFIPLQMQNSRMSDENSERLEKLESHVAHLEHQVEQLNDVVIEQGKLLDKLKKETQRQSSSLQTLELERMKSNVQKPPHYQ
jgi:SlyX protein